MCGMRLVRGCLRKELQFTVTVSLDSNGLSFPFVLLQDQQYYSREGDFHTMHGSLEYENVVRCMAINLTKVQLRYIDESF